jgi:CubicO group peptidase (beta-lactamase class C family)
MTRIKIRTQVAGILMVFFLFSQAGFAQKIEQKIDRVISNLQVIDNWKALPNQTGESSTLARRMEFYKIPGVTIAVINDNSVEWTRGFGYLKAGSPEKVTGKSIFETGSVSKFVTALITLHFVEEGLLDLDSDVNRFLKSWKVPDNEFTRNKKVTLRSLLSHQAGIPSSDLISSEEGKPLPTLPQVLSGEKPALNPAAVPEFEPGSQWS